jgi:hypothetical protein
MIDFAELAIRTDYSSVDKAASALDRLTAAGQKAEQATSRLGSASAGASRQTGAWESIHRRATEGVEGHTLSVGKLTRAFEHMAVSTLGVNRELALLATIFGDFAVGGAVVAGVVGGIALIGAAYEHFTGAAREAAKAQRELRAALEQGNADEKLGPAPELVKQVQAERDELRREQSRRRLLLNFGVSQSDDRITDLDTQIAFHQQQLIEGEGRLFKARMDAAKPLETVVTHAKDYTAEMEKQARLLSQYNELMRRTYGTLGTVGHDFSGGPIGQQLQNAQQNAQPTVLDILQKFLTNTSEPFKFSGFGKDTEALLRHTDAVAKLNERYDDARSKFSSMTNVVDDFKMGLKEAAAGLLEQFSPSALAQNLVGGIVNQVQGFVSGLVTSAIGGIRHALFGQSGQERDAQRQAEASARAMALQIDAVTKALSGDQLGAAINALQIQLISALQAINSALPGTKNEAERNRLRAEAAAQEQQQEARARHQDELNHRYATEDLQVRNLRALGQGDAADRLAFQEQQQREMQKAIDEGRDATYLNTLATVQNNEWLAFLNGTLQDALRNSPQGFRIDPYLYNYQTPRGAPPADPFGTGMLPPNFPKPDKPGSGSADVLNVNIENITVDGSKSADEVVNTLVDRLDQAAAASGGRGSSRTTALELLKRR